MLSCVLWVRSSLRSNPCKHSLTILFVDAASAEQQKLTGVKQEEEDEEDDIAMDVEEEKDLQAVEAQELKPEKLNDNKASQKGGLLTSTNCVHKHVTCVSMFNVHPFSIRFGVWGHGGTETGRWRRKGEARDTEEQ